MSYYWSELVDGGMELDHLVGPTAAVLKHVEAVISTGTLKPGDRLPTERDLAAAAGVSRGAVRAALQDLESRGVVLRHVGRGTFLSPESPAVDDAGLQPSPAEIMTARLLLEPELMALAVGSATSADLEEMQRCLRAGEQASTAEEFEQWDTALHHSFALATHNTVLINFSSMLIDARHQPTWGGLKKRSFNAERQSTYCSEHEQIVAAIRERDPQTARDAMRAHLRHVRSVLLGGHP
jgi:DNA-binding FadR family transcriptional regulator